MELSIEDKAILSHVVLDPDAWVSHAISTIGERAVTAKIERWRPAYESEKDKPDYKNRADREIEEELKRQLTPEQIERREMETLIRAKIREQAITSLQAEGKITIDEKLNSETIGKEEV